MKKKAKQNESSKKKNPKMNRDKILEKGNSYSVGQTFSDNQKGNSNVQTIEQIRKTLIHNIDLNNSSKFAVLPQQLAFY